MPRRVDGPEITGQVTHKQTGQAYGPVTVTVTPKVYTDPEMTASVTSLTTDGTGVFSCYAPPGTYTFTTTAVDAQTLEPVEVLGREGGTGVSSAASVLTDKGNWTTATVYAVDDMVTQSNTRYVCAIPHTAGTFATDLAAGKWTATSPAAAVIDTTNPAALGGAAAPGTRGTVSDGGHVHDTSGLATVAQLAQWQWKAGNYYGPFIAGAASAGVANDLAPNWCAFVPVAVPSSHTIDKIGVYLDAAGSAGSVLRLGLYADDGTSTPGTLVVDGGTVIGTATGYVEVTFTAVAVARGMYWLAIAAQGGAATTPGPRKYTSNAGIVLGNSSGAQAGQAQFGAPQTNGISGAFASNPGITQRSGFYAPVITFHVAT